jgi:hypothetical protein
VITRTTQSETTNFVGFVGMQPFCSSGAVAADLGGFTDSFIFGPFLQLLGDLFSSGDFVLRSFKE